MCVMTKTEVAEWAAFLEEAMAIPESAEDKRRRLVHLHRDVLQALPGGYRELIERIEATIMELST